ncbi:hypothetical protein BDV96DRAFT_648470 [Lophiotrema nucula]|uniref:Large ribosomal subunit protein mL59 domain-containing protein n=1 Tax=Lophiotrema nucula TaxID=690887 RepID=A0A6A5Z3E2_9PLEO|nr:hypothetical protein BDV96DRAFT_648470 [Lophiotrema nucula]
MATQQLGRAAEQVALAKSLPPRLLRFFARYPPGSVAQTAPTAASTTISTTPPSDPNAPVTEASTPSTTPPSSSSSPALRNPFLPSKNYTTGTWYGPRYGLRQQADLVKLAQTHGVLDLLPYTTKLPGEKEKRRVEKGLRVKGTGVGEKVKGKGWERTLKGKLALRRKAMERMPSLVQEWKQKGHGRGWKKWPKAGGHGVL